MLDEGVYLLLKQQPLLEPLVEPLLDFVAPVPHHFIVSSQQIPKGLGYLSPMACLSLCLFLSWTHNRERHMLRYFASQRYIGEGQTSQY